MHHDLSLIPDWTLLIQLGLFLASFLVLHFLVFKPYQELLHARHEKTAGLKEKAEEAQVKAQQYKEEYEVFMRAERKRISTFADGERQKISEEERTIIQAARDSVAGELGALRQKVGQEKEQARKDLTPFIPELSSLIASKLTGQKIKIPAGKTEAQKGSSTEQPTLS